MKRKILIVDDEKNTREGLKWALENKYLDVLLASNGEEALKIVENVSLDLAITDLKMPGIDGMTLLSKIKEESPYTDVVLLTGHGTVESAVAAMKKGAIDYLMKPVNIDELNLLVERIMMERSLKEENQILKEQVQEKYGFEKIIWRSQVMEKIIKKVRLVAPTKATVIIAGESGTGKELIASAIHYNSPRRTKSFIKVNCGALSPTLLESELFGHEKGAFTHAFKQKQGRFELANGGTIFLDEIGETTYDFQIKLLRILQEQEFERVGGTETIKIDVRVITSTNKNLDQLLKEKKIREDLYYRLKVIPIEVPPLRERVEDIPLLVDAFIEEFCRENNKEKLILSPKVIEFLETYHWPGNVRQLKNVIEGLVVMSPTREITPKNLPEEIRLEGSKEHYVKLRSGITIKEAEKDLIHSTLIECGRNKAKTARILGVGRKTLYRKMKEYGLE